MCPGTAWIYALSIGGGPPNVDFTLTLRLILVWIRIRVSMMVIVFVISVWIRRLRPIFPLSQVELCLAVRERWRTAANFDRRSHCPGTMSIFLLSRSTSALNTLQAALGLWFILEEKETSTNRHTKFKRLSFFTLDRRAGSLPHRPAPVFGRSAASARSGAGAATFRSNRKYRYRTRTQSNVWNCWPWNEVLKNLFPIPDVGNNFALRCLRVRGCTAAGRSRCSTETAKKNSHPRHFRCWSPRRNGFEGFNLVYWREALHCFSLRGAIIVVGFELEKHFDGDFISDQGKEITFKRWLPGTKAENSASHSTG